MIDTGASGYAFISNSFAQTHDLPLAPLSTSIALKIFDGRSVVSGNRIHKTILDLSIRMHCERMPLLVIRLGHYPIVLAIPWLRRHNPLVKFSANTLIFNSSFCTKQCLSSQAPQFSARVSGRTPANPTTSLYLHRNRNSTTVKAPAMDIQMIGADAFQFFTKRSGMQIFLLSNFAIDKALNTKHSNSDIQIVLDGKPTIDPLTKLPPEYRDYADVFSVAESDKLSPHRSYDHKIQLEPGKNPDHGPMYGMSKDELLVLKKYLEDNLCKRFIRANTSSATSPILFVKNPGGGLRFCIDYWKLNAITVKDKYPIPLIQETLNRLSQACWFLKFDVIATFNKMRMQEGKEWKTAFKTRYGLYEYLVMPFGLANAPSSFQHFINDTLQGYLDIFTTAYIDDILVYSNSLSEHKKHVKLILDRIRDAGLQLDIAMSKFHIQEVTFLGLLVGKDDIRMDPKKIETV